MHIKFRFCEDYNNTLFIVLPPICPILSWQTSYKSYRIFCINKICKNDMDEKQTNFLSVAC